MTDQTHNTTPEVVIYHNPACGSSRNSLALIREAGIEPRVVEYLKTPLDKAGLVALLGQMGASARDLLRDKGDLYKELALDNPALSDDALLDAIAAHPVLMNRPVVVTHKGARLCRPPETVLALLPARD